MAIKRNNVIPNVHFRKWWQRHVKTWFNQPARKERRRTVRKARIAKAAPRPAAGLLRPAVRCSTLRYNNRVRVGRGFTLEELKAAKIPVKKAISIGIAVDTRRTNKCEESLKLNADRLKQYMSKLKVAPLRSKPKKGDATKAELANVAQNTHKHIIPLPAPAPAVLGTAKVTDAMREVQAYRTVRQARVTQRLVGVRAKQAAAKEAAKKDA